MGAKNAKMSEEEEQEQDQEEQESYSYRRGFYRQSHEGEGGVLSVLSLLSLLHLSYCLLCYLFRTLILPIVLRSSSSGIVATPFFAL